MATTQILFGPLVAVALLAVLAVPAAAQAGRYGTYHGTVKVSGTEREGETKLAVYEATIEIAIPVNDGSTSTKVLEISDVERPSGRVTVTKYELEERNASPDSDGKYTSWKCRLDGQVTVPAMAQGVLNISPGSGTYSTYVALVSTEPVPLSCVNSRTGAYRRSEGMTFFFGTNEPSAIPYTELPFTDAARIVGRHTLVPEYEMKDTHLPQAQEWQFVLRK